MAAFQVNVSFKLTEDMPLRHLVIGAFYQEGTVANGLTAPEAAELLKVAPEGALTPVDEEAQTLATRHISLSGSIGVSSETKAGKNAAND